jgi:NitT/TauT family transport system ATP-binding protein
LPARLPEPRLCDLKGTSDQRLETIMTALMQLAGLRRAFGGETVLDGLDLTVDRGEIVSLIGASGSGKSTALRLIAGLDQPDGGEIVWQGDRPVLGFVFQDPTLLPWADVFDNVWLPLRFAGTGRREARPAIEAALDLVGLGTVADKLPRQLSGGMRMRVSIARAIVGKPELLLMDEPFAALDEIGRERLNDELLSLRERLGLTVIFVTHSVAEAAFLSDRVAVMTPSPARIASVETVALGKPRSRETRGSSAFFAACERLSQALRRVSG